MAELAEELEVPEFVRPFLGERNPVVNLEGVIRTAADADAIA